MMTDQEKLLAAYRAGHFWNASKPDVLNVDPSSLHKLTTDHPIAKQAIQSWQEADENYNALVAAFYKGSQPDYDGEIGPATDALMHLSRCPMPDHPPPPGATFDYGEEGINRAVESMQRAFASGSGSWPMPGCDPDRQGVHSIRVRIDPANMPSTIRAYHERALAEVVKAYAEIGIAVRYILAASGDCEIAKRFESLAGSVIGWNEFPSSDTCQQEISGRLDTGYAPSNWLLWANLECHETGHGVGLQHTRGSIMNPSILLVEPMTWVGTPSYSTLKRYFGGEPIAAPGPGPGPIPVPIPGALKMPIKISDADGKAYGIHPWSDV